MSAVALANMNVALLYFDGCPNWVRTAEMLVRLSGEYDIHVELVKVTSEGEAERLGFRGSPTVLIDGSDPFADASAPVGLACRVYRGSSGLVGAPDEGMVRAALEAAAQS